MLSRMLTRVWSLCRYLSSHTPEGSAWALPDADPSPSGMWLNYLRSLEWALQTTFSYAATSPAETVGSAVTFSRDVHRLVSSCEGMNVAFTDSWRTRTSTSWQWWAAWS